MDELVKNGRKLYAAREFGKALIHFTRAMHMCSCNKNQKRKRCACKDYEAVASRDGSIYDEAMFTCFCDASKLFSKCEDELHLAALDARAATFEALQELDRAEADAKWMLELAPGLPHGYLRFGKIARLRKNAWLAWKIYSAGVDANKNTSLESSSQLQTYQKLKQLLQPLQLRFNRKDPLILPLELIYLIFENLSPVDLTKCLRVSKAWNHVLTRGQGQSLWRQLDFLEPPPRPLSVKAMKTLVGRSGNTVRSIVIKDATTFKLNQEKLGALVRHAKTLEHLEINHSTDAIFPFPDQPGSYKKLRSLVMDLNHEGVFVSIEGLRPVQFVSVVAANSLEHLDLIRIPSECGFHRKLPDFPRLKTLRLGQKDQAFGVVDLPIFELARKTPQLEQLSINGFPLTEGDENLIRDWHTLWSKLEVFVFRMPKHLRSRSPFDTLTCVMLVHSLQMGNGFRHLELDIPYDNHMRAETNGFLLYSVRELSSYTPTLAATISRMPCLRQFAKLRALRLKRLTQSPRTMQALLVDPMANGCFREFDIVFPFDDTLFPEGQASIRHLRGYNWLRGLKSIRYMGLSNFHFPPLPTRDYEDPLPAFLGSFPKLETVSLSSQHVSDGDFYRLVTRIMSETPVRTIYQSCVTGSLMDKVVAEGAEQGVEVIWGERPHQWPVPLED
ncbi:hypothetical protein CP532_0123 [Ophiocordyceps camponoti-leonardi (nom. inval.)]|nr:hypothetical protein CP532_0123 [Ophiocordyceps camponoti-leonardi (nom. inval.)]